jgi:hypothetical protein
LQVKNFQKALIEPFFTFSELSDVKKSAHDEQQDLLVNE